MRQVFFIGILGLAATAALGACSSTSGGEGGGTTASASHGSATAGSTGSTGSGGAATGSGSSSSGTGGSTTSTAVNGCTAAAATDMTGMTAVTINFGGATLGDKYSPDCIKVTAGTKVTFAGDFTVHPLVAGDAPPATPDTTGPITATSTGMSATFTMTPAGTYGYYCSVHVASAGMEGAIIVQ
jgi:plastocyanin